MLKFIYQVILVCAVTVFLAACQNDPPQQQSTPPIPVKVAKPDQREVEQTIPVSGTVVSPFAPTRCSFLLAGKVTQVKLREGEAVKRDKF